MSYAVYVYADANKNQEKVASNEINWTGTWSSSGTYFTSTLDSVLYGDTRYVAIIDNVGVNPLARLPNKQPNPFSALIVVQPGDEPPFTPPIPPDLPGQAYTIAVAGTTLAYQALQTAWTGTSIATAGTLEAQAAIGLANQALVTAFAGTSVGNQALTVASSGTAEAAAAINLANQAFVLAAQGTAHPADVALAYLALQTAWSGTSGVNEVFPIATSGTSAAAAAIDLANQAFVLASQGTAHPADVALAYTALQTAWSGTSGANAAFALATHGTFAATGSTPGQLTLSNDLAGPAHAPTVIGASGTFSFKGINTATLGPASNNFDPGQNTFLRLTPDATFQTVMTGIANGWPGRILIIVNVDQSGLTLTLRPNNGASSSANQFGFSSDLVLHNNEAVILVYDATLQKWFVLFNGIQVAHDIGGTPGSPVVLRASTTFQFSGTTTNAQITSDQNDYSLGGSYNVVRLTSDAPRNITGLSISGNSSGRVVILHNVGSFPLTFKNQSASSSGINRLDIGSDFTLQPSNVCIVQYDNDSTKWRILGFSPSDIYGLAGEALSIAQTGTLEAAAAVTLANQALTTAYTGTALAQLAYNLIQAGTDATAAIAVAYQALTTAWTGTAEAASAIALGNQALATSWSGTNAITLANQALSTAWSGTSAIAVAEQALALAWSGTNAISLANQALQLAWAGTNAITLANKALQLAWVGTAAVPLSGGTMTGNLEVPNVFLGSGTVSTAQAVSGTIYYDFTGPGFQETTVDTNIWVSAKNLTPGAEICAVLLSNGAQKTIGYDSTFSWFGTQIPVTSATNGKKVLVPMSCTGTVSSKVNGASTAQL